jgi:hypothetical protein
VHEKVEAVLFRNMGRDVHKIAVVFVVFDLSICTSITEEKGFLQNHNSSTGVVKRPSVSYNPSLEEFLTHLPVMVAKCIHIRDQGGTGLSTELFKTVIAT